MKAALACVLFVPCGLRRQNVQVDLGATKRLTHFLLGETWAACAR